METQCQIPKCFWTGDRQNLLKHCQKHHGALVKELIDEKYFNLTFKDIYTKAFLLNGKNELYWFILDSEEMDNGICRGIFSVNGKTRRNYTIQLGQGSTDFVTQLGPFPIRSKASTLFDWKLSFDVLEFYIKEIPSRSMQIYIDPKSETRSTNECHEGSKRYKFSSDMTKKVWFGQMSNKVM